MFSINAGGLCSPRWETSGPFGQIGSAPGVVRNAKKEAFQIVGFHGNKSVVAQGGGGPRPVGPFGSGSGSAARGSSRNRCKSFHLSRSQHGLLFQILDERQPGSTTQHAFGW